jgi:predicted RNA-binding Zn ribbon-like protein
MVAYEGPVRDEPLAVELHNTVYARQGVLLDGLADPRSAAAWLDSVGDRLPGAGSGRMATTDELIALRHVVRSVLHAAIEDRTPSRQSIEALNRASTRAARSPVVRWSPNEPPLAGTHFHGASRADIVVSTIAADTITLITGPARSELRACGAPGCVLMFLRDHPRREWCSPTCGNRARQARHYRRTRERTTTV